MGARLGGESIRSDLSISDYHRVPLAFQLRSLPANGVSGGTKSRDLPRFQAERPIQRCCDVDHIDALEEFMPRLSLIHI